MKYKCNYEKQSCKIICNYQFNFYSVVETASIHNRSMDQFPSLLFRCRLEVELWHNLNELDITWTTNPQCFVFDLNDIAFKCPSCWIFLEWRSLVQLIFHLPKKAPQKLRAVITGTLNQMQPFSLFCFCVDDEQHRINMFPLIALVSTYI